MTAWTSTPSSANISDAVPTEASPRTRAGAMYQPRAPLTVMESSALDTAKSVIRARPRRAFGPRQYGAGGAPPPRPGARGRGCGRRSREAVSPAVHALHFPGGRAPELRNSGMLVRHDPSRQRTGRRGSGPDRPRPGPASSSAKSLPLEPWFGYALIRCWTLNVAVPIGGLLSLLDTKISVALPTSFQTRPKGHRPSCCSCASISVLASCDWTDRPSIQFVGDIDT